MTIRLPETEFLPWTKALQAAGAPETIKNARGYWGFAKGRDGRVVCSVWSDNILAAEAKAFIPKVDKGGYRIAASSLDPGDEVIVVLRSRSTKLGKVLPTLWRVKRMDMNSMHSNNVGTLLLANTGKPI